MNSPAIEASNQREIFLGGIRLFIDYRYLDDSKNRPVDVPRLLHHALRAAGAIGGVAVEGDGGLGASESIKIRIPLLEGLNEISVHLQQNTQLTIYFLERLSPLSNPSVTRACSSAGMTKTISAVTTFSWSACWRFTRFRIRWGMNLFPAFIAVVTVLYKLCFIKCSLMLFEIAHGESNNVKKIEKIKMINFNSTSTFVIGSFLLLRLRAAFHND